MSETEYTIFDKLKEKIERFYLPIIKKGMLRVMNEGIEIKEYIEESGEFWTQAVKDMLKESITVIESASRHLVTVNGIVIGVYFHAITYNQIASKLSVLASLIYLTPVVCWLLSLVSAVLVISPKSRPMRYINEDIARKDFLQIANDKFLQYHRALMSFIAGVVCLLLVLFHYLVIL